MRRMTMVVAAAVGLVSTAAVCAAQDAPERAPLLQPDEKPGLKVGDNAIELAGEAVLLDTNGREVLLADVLKGHISVLTFYRGGWCPYCNKALAQWSGRTGPIDNAGGKLIAISPETPEHALETAQKANAGYEVYIDPTGHALRAMRVAFALDANTQRRYRGYGIDLSTTNANGEWVLPVPATYVIDVNGNVTWVFADWDYKKRADPENVIEAVDELK